MWPAPNPVVKWGRCLLVSGLQLRTPRENRKEEHPIHASTFGRISWVHLGGHVRRWPRCGGRGGWDVSREAGLESSRLRMAPTQVFRGFFVQRQPKQLPDKPNRRTLHVALWRAVEVRATTQTMASNRKIKHMDRHIGRLQIRSFRDKPSGIFGKRTAARDVINRKERRC